MVKEVKKNVKVQVKQEEDAAFAAEEEAEFVNDEHEAYDIATDESESLPDEDDDDDGDTILDSNDACPRGMTGWISDAI